ncbi:hypothetical protein pb186bvf_014186 [Paramecium bursaria]
MAQEKIQFQTYAEAIAYMNQLTGSVKSMWYALDMKGYYLPEYSSTAVTAAYLWKIANNKCFHLFKKETQQGTLLKPSTKANLLDEISLLVKSDMAINEKNMPDKTWLINVLFFLNPNHSLFKKPFDDAEMQVTKDQIQLLKDLDTSLFRGKGRCIFFRRTQEQVIAQKYDAINQRISKQKARIQRKQKEKNSAISSLLRAEGKQENLKRTLEFLNKDKKL